MPATVIQRGAGFGQDRRCRRAVRAASAALFPIVEMNRLAPPLRRVRFLLFSCFLLVMPKQEKFRNTLL